MQSVACAAERGTRSALPAVRPSGAARAIAGRYLTTVSQSRRAGARRGGGSGHPPAKVAIARVGSRPPPRSTSELKKAAEYRAICDRSGGGAGEYLQLY